MASPEAVVFDGAAMVGELRRACGEAGSQRAWAAAHGFSDAYVSDVLGGRRDVSEALANALGFVRRVRFHKIAKGAGDAEA